MSKPHMKKLFSSFTAVAVACVLLYLVSPRRDVPAVSPALSETRDLRSVELLPVREVFAGLELIWQLPSTTSPIAGIVLLFHGCSRKAASFFYSPEGRVIMESILASNMGIIAFPKQEESGCWSVEDEAFVTASFRAWQSGVPRRFPLVFMGAAGTDAVRAFPPVFGFGASSGGSMVAAMAAPLGLAAINVQIMAPHIAADQWEVPAIFTIMSRDKGTKARVAKILEVLAFKNIRHDLVVTQIKKIVGGDYFSSRLPGLSPAVAGSVYSHLREGGFLNQQGELLVDPRATGKNGVCNLEPFLPSGEKLPWGVSPQLNGLLNDAERKNAQVLCVAELLNVAWNMHEITSEFFADRVLPFFLVSLKLKT